MRNIFPDDWSVVRITSPAGESMYKVFAGWRGGYLDADSWKISSAINKVQETSAAYTFTNESGSVYQCAKNAEYINPYMATIFDDMRERLRNINGNIEIVPTSDLSATLLKNIS